MYVTCMYSWSTCKHVLNRNYETVALYDMLVWNLRLIRHPVPEAAPQAVSKCTGNGQR